MEQDLQHSLQMHACYNSPMMSHVFFTAAITIRKRRDVVDFFSGGDTIPEAIEARNQLTDCLGTAGLPLGKWTANNPQLLPQSYCDEQSNKDIPNHENEAISTLGIIWIPDEDEFSLEIEKTDFDTQNVTKRIIASEAAKLFDPIGWLSPVIIRPKIL